MILPLTDQEQQQEEDRLVLDDRNADIVPDVPSFKAPELAKTRIQIGLIEEAI